MCRDSFCLANNKVVVNWNGSETKPSDQWIHVVNPVNRDIDITYKLNHPVIVYQNDIDNVYHLNIRIF